MDSKKIKKSGKESLSNTFYQQTESLEHSDMVPSAEKNPSCPESGVPITDVFMRLDDLDQKLEKIEQIRQDLSDSLLREKGVISKLQEDLDSAIREKNDYSEKLLKLQSQKDHFESELTDIQKQFAELSAENAQNKTKCFLAEEELKNRNSETDQLTLENADLKQKSDAAYLLTNKFALRVQQLSKLESQQQTLHDELIEKKCLLENRSKALEQKQKELSEIREQLLALWQEFQKSQIDRKQTRENLISAWKQLQATRNDLKTSRDKFKSAWVELRNTREDLKESRTRLSTAWQELKTAKTILKEEREQRKTAWIDLQNTRKELKKERESLKSAWQELCSARKTSKNDRDKLLSAWKNLQETRVLLKDSRESFVVIWNALRDTRIQLKQSGEKFKQTHLDLQSTRKELKRSREQLQSAWQELQKTCEKVNHSRYLAKHLREELKSTRIELKKCREHLQTAWKELQSSRIRLKNTQDDYKQTWQDLQNTRNALNCSQENWKSTWQDLLTAYHNVKTTREELAGVRAELKQKQAENAALRELLDSLQEFLNVCSQNRSFRMAKAIQILRQPSAAGLSGKVSAMTKLLGAVLAGKEFCPETKAMDPAVDMIKYGLNNVARVGEKAKHQAELELAQELKNLTVPVSKPEELEKVIIPESFPDNDLVELQQTMKVMPDVIVPEDLNFADEVIIPDVQEPEIIEIPANLPQMEPVVIPESPEEEEIIIPEELALEEEIEIPENLNLGTLEIPGDLILAEAPAVPGDLELEEIDIPEDFPIMNEVIIPEIMPEDPEVIIPEDLSFSEEITIPEKPVFSIPAEVSPEEVSEICRKAVPELDVPDESIVISVILPIYNQADVAAHAIESVIAQTYKNWELLIINDGSTDHLADVVKPYLADKRIRYLEQENQKLSKALNNGFALARGNFLTWTSADNIMQPQMLRRLSAFLRQNPVYSMVYADYSVIDANGEPFVQPWFRPHNKKTPESPEIHLPGCVELLNVIRDNFIGACFMYRRTVPAIIGEYDPILGIEDYDYWMRINSTMKISHLGTEEILYQYRVHDNSLSAHMVELNITEKCENLMEYERDRWSFQCKPFEVYALFPKTNQNFRNMNLKFHYSRLEEQTLPGALEKRVLLVKGSDLSSFTPQELECYNFIGAYFDIGTANDAGKNSYLIRRFQIQCFAKAGTEEFERLQVITPNCFNCQPQDFGYYSLLIANNRIFFQATHSEEELKRTMPAIPENNSGRIIVMLQKIANGGMEQVTFDMVRNFKKAGKNVLLLCLEESNDEVKLPEDLDHLILNPENKEAEFREFLQKEKTIAVISHFCTWGAKIVKNLGIPFYQVIHNTYTWLTPEQIKEYQDTDNYTTAYIAVSSNVAWYSMEVLKLPAKKMVVIENGVEFENFQFSEEKREESRKKFNFSEKDFVFLLPANCYGCKGQLNLVLAFANAYRKNPNLRLILAGKIIESHYFAKIQKIIAENKLQDAVISGYFNNMVNIYSAADAVVLPSFWEGCSLSVAEALHLRKPLLATKVGDIERQTDYKNAILIDIPFKYLTQLGKTNCTKTCYTVNTDMVEALEDGIHKIVSGDYSHASGDEIREQPAAEVYSRYLKLLNLNISGKFTIDVIRHNI